MSLKEKLQQDLAEAMKAKDDRRVQIIRLLRDAIRKQEIDQRKELLDEDIIGVLQRAAKQHQDSINAYRAGNRIDLVEQEEAELAIIQSYLPQPLTEDELIAIIDETIRTVGATGPKDIGKVMGPLMTRVKGRADGAKVQAIVRAKRTG